MSKEAQEEAMASAVTKNSGGSGDGCYSHAVMKGKRTKRMRLLQVLAPAAAACTSSASTSGELSGSTTTTEEEEDMANCLILLAQGGTRSEPWLEEEAGGGGGGGGGGGERDEKLPNRRPAEAAITNNGKAPAAFCVYECKTCNKCFPSFQALGGHRASHKKPKTTLQAAAAMAAEEKRAIDENSLQIRIASCPEIGILPNNGSSGGTITSTCCNNAVAAATTSSIAIASINNKPRVHECSICGSEFSSGQALGGHMRRHRAPAPEPQQKAKKDRSNILSLDLNLPAPSDDVVDRGDFAGSPSPFAFSAKRPLIFSTSALVDCHY